MLRLSIRQARGVFKSDLFLLVGHPNRLKNRLRPSQSRANAKFTALVGFPAPFEFLNAEALHDR
jgi:hypothetical protein